MNIALINWLLKTPDDSKLELKIMLKWRTTLTNIEVQVHEELSFWTARNYYETRYIPQRNDIIWMNLPSPNNITNASKFSTTTQLLLSEFYSLLMLRKQIIIDYVKLL